MCLNKTLPLLIFLLLFSCVNNVGNQIGKGVNKEETELLKSIEMSASDKTSDIRYKVKKIAELDDLEFKERELYDDFYKTEITKFSTYIKGSDKKMVSVIVHLDTLRFVKMNMHEIGKQNAKKAMANIKKVEAGLRNLIEKGVYEKVEGKYVKAIENGEIWYMAFFVSQHKADGRQSFWIISAPEKQFGYLKFLKNKFKSRENSLIKFLLNPG